MSVPAAAEEHNLTSETPLPAAQADPQAVQAPIQPEGEIAIDDSNSAYSDDM